MDKKKSFLVFAPDFLAVTARLTDKQRGELITSLCEFVLFGKPIAPISEGVVDAYEYLRETIARNLAKYNEICEKRRASGALGGSSSKSKANDEQMLGKDEPPEEQTSSYNDNDNDDEPINKPDNDLNFLKENKTKENFSLWRPNLEDVQAYCKERGNNIDPEKFIKFYDERNWKQGKDEIRDWRKKIRKWEGEEQPGDENFSHIGDCLNLSRFKIREASDDETHNR